MSAEYVSVSASRLCFPLGHRMSIRLLTLHPGIATDPIITSLDELILDSEDATYEFEALSYTWDDQLPSHIMTCNGLQSMITENVKDALLALRRPDVTRELWIDQVCINQLDIDERSQQVTLMSNIYSRAKRVIVWLGAADEHTERVFDLLKVFAGIKQQGYIATQLCHVATGRLPEHLGSDLSKDRKAGRLPDICDLPTLPTAQSQDFGHIQSLLSRTWFTRVWTYQEIILGGDLSEVRQGNSVIPVFEFIQAMRVMDSCGYFKEITWSAASKAHFYCRSVGTQRLVRDRDARPLHSQLLVTQGLFCKDPRDKVYAMRGLCSNKYQSLLVPDYSLPLGQVYGTAVKACINLENSLDVLGHLQWFDDRPADLPSWVPDWREQRSAFGLNYNFRDMNGDQYYQASRGRDAQIVHCDDPSHLVLRGLRFGKIKRALRHRLSPHESEPSWKECPRWRPEVWCRMYRDEIHRMAIPKSCARDQETLLACVKSDTQALRRDHLFFTDNLLDTALRRTLTADMYPLQLLNRLGEGNRLQFFSAFAAWRGRGYQDAVPKEVLIEHDRYVYQVMRSRDLFVVGNEHDDAYLCATTVLAQPGDWVCVLSGGNAPFVLRQRDTDSGLVDGKLPKTWELIGDCYVHGIMDGEFVRGKDPKTDEVFILA